MTRNGIAALALLATLAAPATALAAQERSLSEAAMTPSAWNGDESSYEANLTRCIARSGRCDTSSLSKIDRDYLTYEMKDQRFDQKTVRQVVAVRMEYYGQEVPVIRGHSSGTRYPADPVPSAPSAGGGEGGIVGLSSLATPDNMKAIGGVLAKGLGAALNGAS